MKVAPFNYHAPGSTEDALALRQALRGSEVLAGGQSLVPYLAFRMRRCEHLIDLNGIPELAGIKEANGRLEIGAMERQRTIAGSALVGRHAPIAQDALKLIGHIATRTRGTLGGSLCNMDPAAELFGVSALHDAVLHVQSARGARDICIDDWAEAFMKPALAPDEMLTRVSWLCWPPGHGHGFVEFSKRHHDYAVVAAGALVTIDAGGRMTRAALMVLGCSIKPERLRRAEAMLLGETGSPDLFRESAREVESLPEFPAELADQGYPRRFVSGEFRRRLGLELTERAIGMAYASARPFDEGR
jgi:aerobic carbon-monoxide dehydrogenase medium subunit